MTRRSPPVTNDTAYTTYSDETATVKTLKYDMDAMKSRCKYWLLPALMGTDPVPLGDTVSREDMKRYLKCQNPTLSRDCDIWGESDDEDAEEDEGWRVVDKTPDNGLIYTRHYFDATTGLNDASNPHTMAMQCIEFDCSVIMEIK
jgi:hypothetical protein